MTSNKECTKDRGTPTPKITSWYKDYDTVIQPPHRHNPDIIPLYQRSRAESPNSILKTHSTHHYSCEEKDTQLQNKEDAPEQKRYIIQGNITFPPLYSGEYNAPMVYSPTQDTSTSEYVTERKGNKKNTSTSNTNTSCQSNTVLSTPTIQRMHADVLQYMRAIQTLSWISNGYHAYTYTYDTHFTLNNYETETYKPTYSTLDFVVSF